MGRKKGQADVVRLQRVAWSGPRSHGHTAQPACRRSCVYTRRQRSWVRFHALILRSFLLLFRASILKDLGHVPFPPFDSQSSWPLAVNALRIEIGTRGNQGFDNFGFARIV